MSGNNVVDFFPPATSGQTFLMYLYIHSGGCAPSAPNLTALVTNFFTSSQTGVERNTFAFGILLREWRGIKANGHVQEVLNFIKTLN